MAGQETQRVLTGGSTKGSIKARVEELGVRDCILGCIASALC